VARDAAFCFLYAENLELLEALGCELAFFSPLEDAGLPEDSAGLMLCGGYPELVEARLRAGTRMNERVKAAIEAGLPTIAECGGFMYLHYAGVIEGQVFKRDRLQRFGYCEITAKRDNLLCRAGERIRAHEFHYYDSDNCGADFHAVKPVVMPAETHPAGGGDLPGSGGSGIGERGDDIAGRVDESHTIVHQGQSWDCVHASATLWAGFPHLYFPANPAFARNFVEGVKRYAMR